MAVEIPWDLIDKDIKEKRERQRVDFKETLLLDSAEQKANLAKDICAMVNSAPADELDYMGLIVLGINKSAQVVGFSCSNPDEFERRLHDAVLSEYILPTLTCSFHYAVHPSSQRHLGIIEVPAKRDRPFVLKKPYDQSHDRLERGEVWVRHGAQNVRASRDELIKMCKEDQMDEVRRTHKEIQEDQEARWKHERDALVAACKEQEELLKELARLYRGLSAEAREAELRRLFSDYSLESLLEK